MKHFFFYTDVELGYSSIYGLVSLPPSGDWLLLHTQISLSIFCVTTKIFIIYTLHLALLGRLYEGGTLSTF